MPKSYKNLILGSSLTRRRTKIQNNIWNILPSGNSYFCLKHLQFRNNCSGATTISQKCYISETDTKIWSLRNWPSVHQSCLVTFVTQHAGEPLVDIPHEGEDGGGCPQHWLLWCRASLQIQKHSNRKVWQCSSVRLLRKFFSAFKIAITQPIKVCFWRH